MASLDKEEAMVEKYILVVEGQEHWREAKHTKITPTVNKRIILFKIAMSKVKIKKSKLCLFFSMMICNKSSKTSKGLETNPTLQREIQAIVNLIKKINKTNLAFTIKAILIKFNSKKRS